MEPLPDCNREVLRSRNLGEKLRDFLVQEAVVHGIEDFAVHDFFQLLQDNDESGTRVDFAFDCNLKCVIVPVAIGVVAFAKDALVLFGRKSGIVVVVRRGELGFAG